MYKLQRWGKLKEREECSTLGWDLSSRKGAREGGELTLSGKDAISKGRRGPWVTSWDTRRKSCGKEWLQDAKYTGLQLVHLGFLHPESTPSHPFSHQYAQCTTWDYLAHYLFSRGDCNFFHLCALMPSSLLQGWVQAPYSYFSIPSPIYSLMSTQIPLCTVQRDKAAPNSLYRNLLQITTWQGVLHLSSGNLPRLILSDLDVEPSWSSPQHPAIASPVPPFHVQSRCISSCSRQKLPPES